MTVSINQLLDGEERPLTVKVGRAEVHLTYIPERITGEHIDRVAAAGEAEQVEAMARVLAGRPAVPAQDAVPATDTEPEVPAVPAQEEELAALTGWDIIGDDGEMLPITVANIKRLPLKFVGAMFTALQEDNNPPASGSFAGG